MYDKKQNQHPSPDLSEMQAVIIDIRTKIYIPKGDDPVEAKERYLARIGQKKP